MARAIVEASSEGLQNTDDGGITAFPFTLYAWAQPVSEDNDFGIVAHVNSGSSNNYYELAMRSTDKGALVSRNTTFRQVSGTTNILNAWHSVLASYVTDTSKKIFVDGIEEGELTTTSTYATSVNNCSIGYLNRSSHADFYDGDIGYVAIWDVILNSVEITALANGVNPFVIRNQNLVTYTELHGNEDPEPNWANRDAFSSPTNFGLLATPTKSTTNPPVQLLSRYL